MLEDSLFASRPSARSRKPATLVLSVLVHGSLAVVLILVPLFQRQVLPQIPLFEALRPPVAARSLEVVPVPSSRARVSSTSSAAPPSVLIAPIKTPIDIVRIVDEPISGPVGFLPNDGRGGPRGLPDGIGDNPFSVSDGPKGPLAPPPPPPPPAVEPAAPKPESPPSAPIRRSSDIVQSNLIHMVKPEYPRLAFITRSHGVVQLEAVITREGTIDPARLRVLKTANTLLTPAAIEAVLQWRYRPTLLNGQPVEVMTTITVNFTMN